MNTKQIRHLRHRLRLTQAEFAQIVGVTQQRVSEWERGVRRITPRMAQQIKDAINAKRNR